MNPSFTIKIAILFDNFGPYHLARSLAASKLLEVLAVEFAGSSKEYAWERATATSSLKAVTLFPGNSSREISLIDFRTKLDECLDTFHPTAVAVPGWSGRGAFLALRWCLRNRVPAIVMSESTAYDTTRSGWREGIKRQYVRLCSAGLVGGKPHVEYLRKLGMEPTRIFKGYDAVDNEYFARGAAETRNQKLEVREKYHLPERYFLASARFIPKKNLCRLIEAYARYRQLAEKPESRNLNAEVWQLVLLGDGELRPTLNSQLSALNLNEHIQMPGFVQYSDLPAYYSLASAFIHASTSEQWGLVVNEAMASGLPVLVSNRCGCAPDLVAEDINGFTFDPENIDQLSGLMLRVSRFNDQVLSAFSAGSERIIADWAPDRFAEGIKAAAQCAVAGKPMQPGAVSTFMLRLLASGKPQ